jgi:DNA polymerase I-like protein with 3'-5' exonuclease and polymerase domains
MDAIRQPLVLNPPPNITRVVDMESLDKLLAFLEKTPEFGFDIETTPTKDYYFRRIRTLQFGNNQEQYVIDLLAWCDYNPDVLYACQGDYGKVTAIEPNIGMLVSKLSPYLSSNKYLKVGVNLGFEYECLYWLLGLRTYGYYDCMLAEKCIYAGLGGHASLKNYGFYSMEDMMDRYFQVIIDKELQTSFNLDTLLTDAQVEYAALDTRTPLAIKTLQRAVANGTTAESALKKGNPKLANFLSKLNPLILGDNLNKIVEIENNALGSFVDMKVHGENFDSVKWLARVAAETVEYKKLLEKLDEFFLPIVGSKNENISDAEIAKLEAEWKSYNEVPEKETNMKKMLRLAKKTNDADGIEAVTHFLEGAEAWRKEQKEVLKKVCGDAKKKRTIINKLFEKCEGEALINYDSSSQLLKILKTKYKALDKETGLDDEVLEKHIHIPIMKLIQDAHGLSKKLSTYGTAWGYKWKTHPCLEEGWLHPGDGRLHSDFNQYDAETGRSSSSKPNGQNIPHVDEVRACWVADEPDEHGERILITIDMSGAELRILTEEAKDPIWIKAFADNEDVHSVCTELVEGEVVWKSMALPDCAYFKLKANGEPQRHKCKCPLHNAARDGMKPTNFGLPYGIGPRKLSIQIGKTFKDTCALMAKHKQEFPYIWEYLADSGSKSKIQKKSFDMFGRRRLFPEPTWEGARERFIEDYADKLLLPDEDCEKTLEAFLTINGRKPNVEEKYTLTHRQPTPKEISKSFQGMFGNMERQGKNHRIQSANATIIKLAMGAGYDPDGKPYLWHLFPKFFARLQKMVHDELVVSVPKIYAEDCAKAIQDAIRRAAAERMKLVEMKSEYHIGGVWQK